ncbi:hypothetical protein [Aeromonas salmonicida]|uniref:hypothetical protein n=1 Tax=Aeromonas salmonicida TaxID=645 RepID=UPI0035A579FC
MSEHTKGLLALFRNGQSVGSADGAGVCEVWPRDENGFPDGEGRANARRIVACWNLLHEFDTEAIEEGTFADFIGKQVYQHEIEQALALLRDLHGYIGASIPQTISEHYRGCDLLDRIDALLADQLPDPAVTVTETIRTAPERIWLQVGDQDHYHSEPFPSDTSEVSWCPDSVTGCEVPYVRADLAGKVPEQHKTNWPDKCPITRRNFFMEIDGVPTYGGPYDSYTIPEMLGTPEQPWHERELFVRRFDHDEGRWVDDEVISQRVIHDGVLDELLDLKEQQADQSGVAPQGGEPCATVPPSSSPA